MKTGFSSKDGIFIVEKMIAAVQANKQYLSDIDGAIGDGDHGINMNRGFTQCAAKLKETPVSLDQALKILSMSLMMVGGSMGPLYGIFFKSMSAAAADCETIDISVAGDMLAAALTGLQKISDAKPGDKTLMDALVPAVEAYQRMAAGGASFESALAAMKNAAEQGRDSTKEMMAKKGRSSRLGERSRGVIDAGAASCALLLGALADGATELLNP